MSVPRCDVWIVSANGQCQDAAVRPFWFECGCGHKIAGRGCAACLRAAKLGCMACWKRKRGRHKCRLTATG